ncbi:tyrosine-type recombinase/integrase [Pseudalkalibacillus decolorationis]|uniref:tyrosine-type recombinase/integrase n=1 Tax=Pseudalkalibacillus decolorationis TaxID=163879 RepID=UPI0035574ED2
MTVFKFFAKYSEAARIQPPISPHDLRHFFCSNALEKGLNVHEVAAIAGHSNIHTTLLYTNPSRKKYWRRLTHCKLELEVNVLWPLKTRMVAIPLIGHVRFNKGEALREVSLLYSN